MGFYMLEKRRKRWKPTGQRQKIVDYLKECKKGKKVDDISKATGIERHCVNARVLELIQEDEIKIIKEERPREVMINEQEAI